MYFQTDLAAQLSNFENPLNELTNKNWLTIIIQIAHFQFMAFLTISNQLTASVDILCSYFSFTLFWP